MGCPRHRRVRRVSACGGGDRPGGRDRVSPFTAPTYRAIRRQLIPVMVTSCVVTAAVKLYVVLAAPAACYIRLIRRPGAKLSDPPILPPEVLR